MNKDEKLLKAAELLKPAEKQFGKGSMSTLGEKPDMDIIAISTGSIGLDIAMGIGGLPKGRIIEILGMESSGKAQPLSSKILTPFGWKHMEDMQCGTIVSTPDGSESTVIGIYPQGIRPIFKITFDDKTFTECTLDHLWQIESRETNLSEVLSTKDLLEKGLNKSNGTRKFKIPTTKSIIFNNNIPLSINPYLLGLLLGDGSFVNNSVKFTTADEEILDNIKEIIKHNYKNLKISKRIGKYDYRFKKIINGHSKNELVLQIEELGMLNKYSYEKDIPEEYLRSSIECRQELLKGLMDSDGSVESGTLSFSTTSKKLSKSFEDLVRGLGMRCHTSSRVTKYTKSDGKKVDGRESYRSTILLCENTFIPFKLKRKVDGLIKRDNNFCGKFIESVEFIGRKHCQCIQIGHPDQLYITDDYIVTHNTTLCTHLVAEAQKVGEICAFIDAEHAFDKKYAEQIGVNTGELHFFQPSSGEEALNYCETLLDTKLFGVIIIDSVAALTPQKEIEGQIGDSTIGLQARMMSQAMRKLSSKVSQSNCIVVFINQWREKIGVMFGSPLVPSGGNALKFYASVRLDVTRSTTVANTVMEGEIKVANLTKVKVIKNKVSAPFTDCEFNIRYGVGIDKVDEIFELGLKYEIIEKDKTTYSFKGSKLATGKDASFEVLKDNPELQEEIEKEIRKLHGIK